MTLYRLKDTFNIRKELVAPKPHHSKPLVFPAICPVYHRAPYNQCAVRRQPQLL